MDPNQTAPFKEQSDQGFHGKCFLECIDKNLYMYICADGIFSTKTMFDVQCNLFSLLFCRKVLLSSMKMERRKITKVRGHHLERFVLVQSVFWRWEPSLHRNPNSNFMEIVVSTVHSLWGP